MRRDLRTQLTRTIVLIVLITIAVISILSNVLIKIEFEKYAQKQQEIRTEDIVRNLSLQYNSLTGQWNIDYIYGVGMYALAEGYVIRLYDQNDTIIWDAEEHDMALCDQIMDDIANRMEKMRPGLKGEFLSKEYELAQNGLVVGKLAITYYGPYFLSENDFQFLNALNLVFIIVGVLSLLSSVIVGSFMAKRISQPLVKTALIAKQIAEGNYSMRFEDTNPTKELEELITAVNHLADSLDRQESLRKQLTTDVAHELRTPLTVIASYLEAMIEGMWEATPERLMSCYEEIIRISGLVKDIESLAKTESDLLKLNKSSVNLFELAQSICSHFEIESHKKNITITTLGEPSHINVDRDRINQVLVNLVSNALNYTFENGHIEIKVMDTAENSILTVADDGIGISEDEQQLIFERFYRTDKSRNRRTGGVGIGLTIVKSIVTAHGGKIEVHSELDRGSIFKISLPKN
jgi:signal transduction histidine kinase